MAALVGIWLSMLLAELVWTRRTRQTSTVYDARDSAANLAILAVERLGEPVKVLWIVGSLTFISEYALFELPRGPAWTLLSVLFVDLAYYWLHRTMHRVEWLWCFHHIHHSSPWLNLTTAIRVHWLSPLVYPPFFAVPVLLGVRVDDVLIFLGLNFFYQLWLHTRSIGRVRWLEGVFNTPSAHRVHHGSNLRYIDRNFGGILLVWDRLFGTYEPEGEPVVYGITSGFHGHNPLRGMLQPFLDLFGRRLKTERELARSRPLETLPQS